ncbi:oxidoreductase [Pilimelia anulata]|nr:oxidoreductase [Pilimelia anulata]
MTRLSRSVSAAALSALALATLATPAHAGGAGPAWEPLTTGSDASLRGLSVVNSKVVWAGGSGGTILRTVDGGGAWQRVGPTVADAAALDFRDVEAVDERRAIALASGDGPESRIYRTEDGGASWTEAFRGAAGSFWDCMTFFDADQRRGLAVADPVDGRFPLISTADGGRTWQPLPAASLPATTAKDEAPFAFTGSCLVAPEDGPAGTAVFATGIGASNYYRTADHGATWSVQPTGFPANETSGVFSLAFRKGKGVAVGGNGASHAGGAASWTGDNGRTWQPATAKPVEHRSSAAWATDSIVLGVGLFTSDLSTDAGRTWSTFDKTAYRAVDCSRAGACFATGDAGRAAVLTGLR